VERVFIVEFEYVPDYIQKQLINLIF
jgi:hypothetical protein